MTTKSANKARVVLTLGAAALLIAANHYDNKLRTTFPEYTIEISAQPNSQTQAACYLSTINVAKDEEILSGEKKLMHSLETGDILSLTDPRKDKNIISLRSSSYATLDRLRRDVDTANYVDCRGTNISVKLCSDAEPCH